MYRVCIFRNCLIMVFAASSLNAAFLLAQPPLPKLPIPPFLQNQSDAGDEDGESEVTPQAVIRQLLDHAAQNPPSPEKLFRAVQQQLGSNDLSQRLEALLALDKQGAPDSSILPKLDEILQHGNNPLERILAASASIQADSDPDQNRRALDQLSSGIRSKDPAIAIQSALGLQQGGKQSEDALLGALADPNPATRSLAAEALGKIDSSMAAERLAGLLQDQDASVRSAAAKSIGLSGANEFTDELLRALRDDPQLSVRANSAASLATVGSDDANIQTALVDAMLGDDEVGSIATIRAIAKSDAPLATRANLLGAALTKAEPVYAAEIIGHLVDMEDPGMQALVRALDSELSRYWAVVALSDFGPAASSAGANLASLLERSTPDVKTEILLTLGNINPPRNAVAASVVKEMSSRENGVRYAATLAAIRLGLQDDAVQSQLAKNRSSEDKVLALISSFALAKLNPGKSKACLDALKSLRDAVASGDPRLKPLAEQALQELKTAAMPSLPKLPGF